MSNVKGQLSTDEKLSLLLNKIDKLESNQQQIISIASRQNATERSVMNIERQVQACNGFLKQLAYHSIDVEARSRRNNLIFYGLADIKHEDTYSILGDFLSDYLDIDIENLFIQRVHRLGSIRNAFSQTQTPRRPIIAAFRDYRDTEFILGLAKTLSGTRFGIDRDHPKEISAARKRLWSRFKQEKSNPRSKVKLVYPAKLVVNGQVLADEFPDWSDVMSMDRCDLFKGHEEAYASVYSRSTQIDSRGSVSQISSDPTMSVASADTTTHGVTFENAVHFQTPKDSPVVPSSQESQFSQSILQAPRLIFPVQSHSGASFNNCKAGLTSTPRQTVRDHAADHGGPESNAPGNSA